MKTIATMFVASVLAGLVVACDGGGPSAPSTPSRAALQLIASFVEDPQADVACSFSRSSGFGNTGCLTDITVTIQESAGVGANIDSLRAENAGRGQNSQVSGNALVNAFGTNHIAGGAQWGPNTIRFNRIRPARRLTVNLTDDNGFEHTLTQAF